MNKKTIPQLQKKVKELYEKNGWDTDPTFLLIAMQEELGELSARYWAEHPDYKKSLKDTDPIPEEVGDLIHLILAFCNKMEINYEECVVNTINKGKNQAK